jgi:hypothetical protein
MGNTIAAFVAVMTLAALDQRDVARYEFTAAWPSKVSLSALGIDSSAPGLLASGTYALDLEVSSQRLTGRLHRGSDAVENIPFTIEGCERVKTPNWSRRATARGMPPAPGRNDRRVELRIAETSTRGCAIKALFTPAAGFTSETDPQPGGSPGSCCPEQGALAKPADLSIRAAKPDPDEPTKIQVQVYNAGPGNAIATQVQITYTKDGKVTLGKAVVPALVAKTSAWVAVGAGLPINAADGVTARVDEPNKVPETNELNNGYKFK